MNKITVKIDTNEKPAEVAKKIMAGKEAFRKALTNGTVEAFARNNSGTRKALYTQK